MDCCEYDSVTYLAFVFSNDTRAIDKKSENEPDHVRDICANW